MGTPKGSLAPRTRPPFSSRGIVLPCVDRVEVARGRETRGAGPVDHVYPEFPISHHCVTSICDGRFSGDRGQMDTEIAHLMGHFCDKGLPSALVARPKSGAVRAFSMASIRDTLDVPVVLAKPIKSQLSSIATA